MDALITALTVPTSNLQIYDHDGRAITVASDSRAVAVIYSTGANLRADGRNASYSATHPAYQAGEPTSDYDDLLRWIGQPLLIARLAQGKEQLLGEHDAVDFVEVAVGRVRKATVPRALDDPEVLFERALTGQDDDLRSRHHHVICGELAQAVEDALSYDDSVLVERHIAGREVHVGILAGRVLGAIEIAPHGGMYDFAAKYTPGMTEYFMPARLGPARYRGVLNLAERAAQALDTEGAVRVDLMVTEGQNEYVLEVNTLPGMTPTSLLPKIAAAAGFDFTALCEAILSRARLHTSIGHPRAAEVVEFPGASRAGDDDLAVVVPRRRAGSRAQRAR